MLGSLIDDLRQHLELAMSRTQSDIPKALPDCLWHSTALALPLRDLPQLRSLHVSQLVKLKWLLRGLACGSLDIGLCDKRRQADGRQTEVVPVMGPVDAI
jgi:hypothetical protein